MSTKTRNVVFALLGAIGLVLGGRYSGSHMELVHSYGGNIAASFAVYFILTHVPIRLKFRKLVTAGLGLAVVDVFEATDGFKVMSNTYDPLDYMANAVGIGLALWIDVAASRIMDPPQTRD